MNRDELRKEILPSLEKVIRFSLLNKLNLHSSIGGKYGELFVVNELWKHDPRIGHSRYDVKDIKNPASSDICLERTRIRLEIKWAMLHHREQDYFFKNARFPFWGWGFGMGNQFLKRKFDYCVLLAAKKDDAFPEHIFVVTCDELIKYMGKKRKSGVTTQPSFYIEYSECQDFFYRRHWQTSGPSSIEKKMFCNSNVYRERWKELKTKGHLT